MKTSIAFGTAPEGLGEIIWRQISRIASGIRHAAARQRAYEALAVLDDRTLEDIGVPRAQIWEVVDRTVGSDPVHAATVTRSTRRIAA